MAVEFHTHTFDIPTSSSSETIAGTRNDVVLTPESAKAAFDAKASAASVTALTDTVTEISEALDGKVDGSDIGVTVQPFNSTLSALAASSPGVAGIDILGAGTMEGARDIIGVTSRVADLQNQIDVLEITQVSPARRIDPVRLRSTSTGALATSFENGDTVDGLVLATNDRIFLDGRTNKAENGVYVVQASGAPVRSTDADTSVEIDRIEFMVNAGTDAGNNYALKATEGIVLGTTDLEFVKIGTSFGVGGEVVDARQGEAALTDRIDQTQARVNSAISTADGKVFLTNVASKLRMRIDSGGLRYDRTNDEIKGPVWSIRRQLGDTFRIGVRNAANLVKWLDVGTSTASTATDEALWTADQYDYVEAEAQTEADRMNSYDVSYLASTTGMETVLRAKTGQSFRAASDNARLFLSALRLDLLGWAIHSDTIGPDSRCVNSGPVFVTYDGDSRELFPLVENFVGPTDQDLIYSDEEVAAGDYPINARGGTPDVLEEFLYQWLRRKWEGRAENAELGFRTIPMNHAKTDGSAAEVFLGDGLDRFESMVGVFDGKVTGTKVADSVDIDHGQADEAAATADYEDRVNAFYDEIVGFFNDAWGQTALPSLIMTQVGGPRYGTAAMVCANAMVDMMRDIDGDSKEKFLGGVSWEGTSFYNVNPEHPNYMSPGDDHRALAGNAMLAIRHAICRHYLHDRKDHYWLPFPLTGYYVGNKFLIAVPCKFPPLRTSKMCIGVTMEMLDHLGFSFESSGGTDNPVTSIRIVDGYNYLVEGTCEGDIAGFTVGKTGKRLLPTHLGVTFMRDSFDIDHPVSLPFDASQTVYATGYQDSPAANGFGRYIEDIPEFVGKPDLGNPVLRRTFTLSPMPEV